MLKFYLKMVIKSNPATFNYFEIESNAVQYTRSLILLLEFEVCIHRM